MTIEELFGQIDALTRTEELCNIPISPGQEIRLVKSKGVTSIRRFLYDGNTYLVSAVLTKDNSFGDDKVLEELKRWVTGNSSSIINRVLDAVGGPSGGLYYRPSRSTPTYWSYTTTTTSTSATSSWTTNTYRLG